MGRLTHSVRRRFAALAAMLSTALLMVLLAGPASAGGNEDYVPTTITPTTIAPTSTSTQPPDAGPLPDTGAGFNVGMTIGLAALILVAGLALCWFGYRMSRRTQH